MHFAITIAAALAATGSASPSFDDALLDVRIDCTVTATILRGGTEDLMAAANMSSCLRVTAVKVRLPFLSSRRSATIAVFCGRR